jgi:PAS domain S-box-containing protein
MCRLAVPIGALRMSQVLKCDVDEADRGRAVLDLVAAAPQDADRLRLAADAIELALVATDEVWHAQQAHGGDGFDAIEASYSLHRAALALGAVHPRVAGRSFAAAFDQRAGPIGPDRPTTDWAWSLLIDAVEEYAIFQLAPDGAVATWNAGARRIKGYAAEEILGRQFEVFYTAEDIAAGKPARGLAHAAAHGECRDEGWRVRKDGTTFWANVVITALFDDDGRLDGFAKVTRDETDRREADERRHAMELLTERERIGVEMSETIVRQIFQTGLHLDATVGLAHDPLVADRIREAVEQLDRAVRGIRMTVLDLAVAKSSGHGGPPV